MSNWNASNRYDREAVKHSVSVERVQDLRKKPARRSRNEDEQKELQVIARKLIFDSK